MSLITEQVKRLREYASGKRGEIADICNEAANTIEELSAKVASANMERSEKYFNGGWIPVSERLPEKEGIYLVTRYDYITEPSVDTMWWNEDAQWVLFNVMAWMPLPEPYKGDEE